MDELISRINQAALSRRKLTRPLFSEDGLARDSALDAFMSSLIEQTETGRISEGNEHATDDHDSKTSKKLLKISEVDLSQHKSTRPPASAGWLAGDSELDAPISSLSEQPETGGIIVGNEHATDDHDPETSKKLLKVSAVLAKALETGDCDAVFESDEESSSISACVKPGRRTTDLTLPEWYELLSEEMDTVDLKQTLIPYFKMIDDTATNMAGRDFKDLAKTIVSLVTNTLHIKLAYVIREAVRDHYGKEYDQDDYNYTLDALENFNQIFKDCRGNSRIFFKDASKIIEALKEKNLLTAEMVGVYIKITKEKDDIQKRLAEFQYIDISGIADYIRSLEWTGLLSDVILTKFKNFVDESKESWMAFEAQLNRMKEFAKYVKDIQDPEKRKHIKPIPVQKVKVLMQIGKSTSKKSKKDKRVKEEEQAKKDKDTERKNRICRLEHSKPLCSNCGWRTSWLKAFKKRGIYVKESLDLDTDYIWETNPRVF